jgi:hypothetical protein
MRTIFAILLSLASVTAASAQQAAVPAQVFTIPPSPAGGALTLIQTGLALKNRGGAVQVQFAVPFSQTPIVVISPEWLNQTNSAQCIETITSVFPTYFSETSGCSADSFFISWIAIGPK